MIEKIATVGIYVADQKAAASFWTEQVGFAVYRNEAMGPMASWLEVGPAGGQSCLVIYPKQMMQDWQERKPSIVFECADIHVTYQELTRRGVKFSEPPKDMGFGTFATFEDPDGNEFGLRGN
ncbi:VOC family protein [Ktedonosporobacter rubrisoli]|uniref:VOC family protein n=1 Tax=Ktedonosporobacter rubrisoli TaxID=2509675 RepID=A0A4P6JLT2_KTERU|nr:VOC family protein [Ktedonosporobacter rubrisoli]QBD76043.1 VOC family protein [Ktedonosporobacter rubrisoli]